MRAIVAASIALGAFSLALECRAAESDEAALVKETVAAVYPLLPADQRALIDRGLLIQISREEPRTSITFGWGPEDDADYRYPDQQLAPAGTIKINLSLKTLELIQLGRRVNSRVARDMQGVYHRILAHELEHALQFTRRPVRGLTGPQDCPAGRCPQELVAGQRDIVEYEFAAVKRGYEESWRYRSGYDGLSTYFNNHPELLTARIKDLPDVLSAWGFELEGVTPFNKKFYGAKASVPELALVYFQEAQAGRADKAAAARKAIQDYLDFNCKTGNRLVRSAPHLAPVFEAVLGSSACR